MCSHCVMQIPLMNMTDVDNLTKFVMDALVDHAYIDDNQVTALIASKRYTDDQPGVKVFLCALAENDSNDDAIEKLMQFSNVVSNAPSR